MNKSELIDAVAESTSLSKADAGRALESVLETIKSTLQSGQKLPFLVLVLLKLDKEMLELVATHKLGKQFKLLLQKLLGSKLENNLRMP